MNNKIIMMLPGKTIELLKWLAGNKNTSIAGIMIEAIDLLYFVECSKNNIVAKKGDNKKCLD